MQERLCACNHEEAAIAPAEERYRAVASGQAPDAMPVLTVQEAELPVIELLRRAGLAASNSEARRLIQGGGIKLNGTTVTDVNLAVQGDAVLSRGKNRFVQIHWNRP